MYSSGQKSSSLHSILWPYYYCPPLSNCMALLWVRMVHTTAILFYKMYEENSPTVESLYRSAEHYNVISYKQSRLLVRLKWSLFFLSISLSAKWLRFVPIINLVLSEKNFYEIHDNIDPYCDLLYNIGLLSPLLSNKGVEGEGAFTQHFLLVYVYKAVCMRV